MVVPERKEEHVWSCALCGHTQLEPSFRTVSINTVAHMRDVHKKFGAYIPDAPRSVTVLFEREDVTATQEMSSIDPTSQFLKVMSWMADRG